MVVVDDDVDNDLMSDAWEKSHGLSASLNDADADADRDGQSNRLEFLAGTDPQSRSSVLKVTDVRRGGGMAEVAFTSVPDRRYQLQSSGNLTAWEDVNGTVLGSVSGISMLNDAASTERRYYRVRSLFEWR